MTVANRRSSAVHIFYFNGIVEGCEWADSELNLTVPLYCSKQAGLVQATIRLKERNGR